MLLRRSSTIWRNISNAIMTDSDDDFVVYMTYFNFLDSAMYLIQRLKHLTTSSVQILQIIITLSHIINK